MLWMLQMLSNPSGRIFMKWQLIEFCGNNRQKKKKTLTIHRLQNERNLTENSWYNMVKTFHLLLVWVNEPNYRHIERGYLHTILDTKETSKQQQPVFCQFGRSWYFGRLHRDTMENFPLRRFSSTSLARSTGYRGRLYCIIVFSKHLRINVWPLSSHSLSAQLPEQNGR